MTEEVLANRPKAPMIEEILTDLYRIEIPLPKNPLRSINSYLFRSKGVSLLVDTGMRIDPCREAVHEALKRLDVKLERTDILVTHLHIDHLGLAKELSRPGRRVYMGENDAEYLSHLPGWSALLVHVEAYGFPVEGYRESFERDPSLAFSPDWWPEFTRVKDGEKIEAGRFELTVVETPGHTTGHICLYLEGEKILLSGDHVLGDISPNITGWDRRYDQLGTYLASLEKVEALEVKLTLPGHRKFIENLKSRTGELKLFHEARLAEIERILAHGRQNAYEIAAKMSWDLVFDEWEKVALPQRWFATGEALSHIRYLAALGRAAEHEENGFYTYSLPEA